MNIVKMSFVGVQERLPEMANRILLEEARATVPTPTVTLRHATSCFRLHRWSESAKRAVVPGNWLWDLEDFQPVTELGFFWEPVACKYCLAQQ